MVRSPIEIRAYTAGGVRVEIMDDGESAMETLSANNWPYVRGMHNRPADPELRQMRRNWRLTSSNLKIKGRRHRCIKNIMNHIVHGG